MKVESILKKKARFPAIYCDILQAPKGSSMVETTEEVFGMKLTFQHTRLSTAYSMAWDHGIRV